MGQNKEMKTALEKYVSIEIVDDEFRPLKDENGTRCRLLAADLIEDVPAMRHPSFIYKVPDRLRVVNKTRYEPRIVSIGPFHSVKKNLRITEKHKKWYLCDLIERSKPQRTDGDYIENRFQHIVEAILKIEAEARNSYAEIIDLNSNDFVKMLILDGCFILELLYRYKEYKEYKEKTQKQCVELHSQDPIFSAAWIVCTLQRDLVLLENQLPFIVLECLFKLTRDPNHNDSLNQLALSFLDPGFPTDLVHRDDTSTSKHLLDLVRNSLLPSPRRMCGKFPKWKFTQYSATDLQKVGVTLKKKKKATGLSDITFKSGVLEIPPIFHGEGMTILLQNLIALEQCNRYYTDHITSYAILLDSLINSKDDVGLLRGRGIIEVMWNEDEKIAAEVNSLCKGVKIDEFYYHELCAELNTYCGREWNKWRASLMHNYFSTPWAILSIIAAFVLLVLTLLQTLFSII